MDTELKSKKCARCQQIKPIEEFYKYKKYYLAYCKNCRGIIVKECHNKPEIKRKSQQSIHKLALEGYFKKYHIEHYQERKDSGYYNNEDRKNQQKIANYKYVHNPENKAKLNARSLIRRLIKSGMLLNEPCFLCGNNKSEPHHPNYNNPLYIIFLCKPCHGKYFKTDK